MQNFLRNAKQALDLTQAIGKEVSNVIAQHQQQTTRRASTHSKSRSRSNSNDSKQQRNDQFKAENINRNLMTSMDNESCFSVLRDNNNFYHVTFLDANLSILKVSNRQQAEEQRNLLNKYQIVAKSAHLQGILTKFVAQANKYSSWSEIHLACLLGLDNAVDKICEKDVLVAINRATPDNGLLPLHVCIQQNNLRLAKKLLSYGADLRKCDLFTYNSLHYAVKNDVTFVKELYETKPDQFCEALHSDNDAGYTPFHLALKYESDQLISYLVKCGANSSLVGVDIAELGVTIPALGAVLRTNPNAMTGDPVEPCTTIFHGKFDRQYLKEAQHWNSKIVDHPNLDRRTPLHCACARNDFECAVDLLAFGASVHKTGKRGNTPLHLAVEQNNEWLIKLLLCFDADYTAKNKDGKTSFDMASTPAISKIFAQLKMSKKSSELEPGHDLPDLLKIKQSMTVEFQELLEPSIREKSLRLLSLDGGGIRGLVMVIMLMRIERETKSGQIVDYFDWIAGTSTGAIFALSLAEGYSTIDCLRFYLRFKDDVFVGNRPYDPQALEEFLKILFGNKTMSELRNKKRVLVTTAKCDTNPPKLALIRSYEMPELLTMSIKPDEIKVWKAARCSSAAPTYFPSVDKKYMDGGLIANNPSVDLISDVYYNNLQLEIKGEKPLPVACLLSLGTEQSIECLDLEMPKTSGLGSLISNMTTTLMSIKNLKNIFVEQLAASDGVVVERSRNWTQSLNTPFFRYTPQLEVECPLNTRDNFEVINLMWTAKLYAESRSHAEIQQIVRLIRAE